MSTHCKLKEIFQKSNKERRHTVERVELIGVGSADVVASLISKSDFRSGGNCADKRKYSEEEHFAEFNVLHVGFEGKVGWMCLYLHICSKKYEHAAIVRVAVPDDAIMETWEPDEGDLNVHFEEDPNFFSLWFRARPPMMIRRRENRF